MINGTNTVAKMIHGPTCEVNSATDGGFPPGACACSIRTMNRPSVTIAHSQQTPTTASAAVPDRGAHLARPLQRPVR